MPSIFPIILNSTHAVAGDTSTYTYKFPRGAINLKGASVAVSTINIYYSWANISASLYNNNQYKILFPDGSPLTFTEYTVTIPDGNYTVEDLNKHLQSFFVSNGKYHINATTGAFRYYMQWISNPTTYSIDLVCYNIPQSLPSGFNEPTGTTFSYPAQANQQPSVEILNNNFGKLVGFSTGIWFDHSSDITPQMATVSSIMVRCSLVNNKFTNPNDIIYAFTTQGANFGNILQVQNNNLIFSKIDDGFYDHVTIKFTDQEYRRLNIKDTNLVIYLIVQIDDIP